MNSVYFTGNLARDPEVKLLPSGSVVANLTVATSRHFTRKNGERDKETAFVACEAWDTAARFIGERLKKGDPICVRGSLKEDRWEQDGKNRSRLMVRINEFEKVERRRARTEESSNSSNSTDSTSTNTSTSTTETNGSAKATPF